ncbi:MAG: tetratricopeptide repeat protein [Nitrospina sp.]|jgi:tetratricopeptide (TPR) repeat protein|nr:tetratricopeptide repeat protein [Nitrospina sp.]MBT3509518.1 tetratricopeptide repeat protein [Nitrospina sp.]MBT3877073.1 tetratricopeptide repeat protein [Nitrospina sp.]MBT4050048.1 tetratricopeptide repeat protein [Nitrospina sp.]MBT4558210.1 tetratricopeptide repeat protein [Nitrospina sp.]
MPNLYFSLSNPESKTAVENIIREFRINLEAECIVLKNTEEFSRSNIRRKISQCDALIIVISRTESATKSLTLPIDESILSERIRFEIISAINLGLMIVPILLDGAVLPERENLEGAMKHLCDCKSYTLRSAFLHENLHEVLENIEEELNFKKEVEEKLSLSVEENFQRLAGYDAKPDKPRSLQSSSSLELRRVVESESIFLKKARAIGDKKAETNALSALAMAYSRLGQTLKAIEFFLQELDITKELGDSEEQCSLLANLGDAFAVSGNFHQAQKYFEEQMALAKAKGYDALIGSSYNGLGFTYVKQNNIEKAIECYIKALASYRQQNNHDKELELLVGIGLNYQKLKLWEQATDFFTQALAIAKYVENRKEESHILIDLAENYQHTGDTVRLKLLLKQAEETLNARDASWTPPLKKRLIILKESLIPK